MGNFNAHLETVAARKLAPPDGFEFFEWKRIGPDAQTLTGGVPKITKTGKNKGRKRWPNPHLTCVVTDAEAEAEHDRYEAETGNCGTCEGKGKTATRWNHKTGTEYGQCSRCGGTGKAPQ